jgi:proliferating cell nuclear antigen
MRVKLENPALLSKAIELISELVLEVRLKVNEFGLSISAIDPAKVAMVGYKLPKSAFSEFVSENETLGINLDDFKKILKRCGAKSSLILEKTEGSLKIIIQDKIKRDFTLALIEIEAEDKEMPVLEFSNKVVVESLDLISAIEDATVVSESCAFEIKDGKFIIEAKGINSARTEFPNESAEIKGEDCIAKYSLEYLQKFIKGSKLIEYTTLEFAKDHPLKFSVKAEHMEIDFILAPRVDQDE